MCKVLVGCFAEGKAGMECKNLPKLTDGVTPVDSTVNQINDPSIFVIYHDAQAFPEYLITYK